MIAEGERSAALGSEPSISYPLSPGAAETKSLAAHGASLGQGEGQTGRSRFRRRSRRHQIARSRAAWWFGQMRKAVNAAVEWKPAPLARPEQTYITLNTGR